MAVMVPSSSAGARAAEGPLAGGHGLGLPRGLGGAQAPRLRRAPGCPVERGGGRGGGGAPAVKVGVPIADVSAGLFGVIGVLSALVERGHSGLGQRVDTSLLAAQIGIHTFQATRYLIAGQVPDPSGNHHPTVAPYGVFEAADRPPAAPVGNPSISRRLPPPPGPAPPPRPFPPPPLPHPPPPAPPPL